MCDKCKHSDFRLSSLISTCNVYFLQQILLEFLKLTKMRLLRLIEGLALLNVNIASPILFIHLCSSNGRREWQNMSSPVAGIRLSLLKTRSKGWRYAATAGGSTSWCLTITTVYMLQLWICCTLMAHLFCLYVANYWVGHHQVGRGTAPLLTQCGGCVGWERYINMFQTPRILRLPILHRLQLKCFNN